MIKILIDNKEIGARFIITDFEQNLEDFYREEDRSIKTDLKIGFCANHRTFYREKERYENFLISCAHNQQKHINKLNNQSLTWHI